MTSLTPLSSTTPATTRPQASSPTVAEKGTADLFADNIASAAKADTAAATSGASISMVYRGSRSGALPPSQQFESFVLRSFVESMLPKEETSYFGTGTAGKIWKSMLAERIGDEMAKSGGIGIADMIDKRNSTATSADAAREKLSREATLATGAEAMKGVGSN